MDHQQFSEADWEILLSYIQERNVIPVIGEGLSMVSPSGSPEKIAFQKWLCNELAGRLNLQPCDSLNDLLGQYSASGQNLKSLYPLIRNLIVQAPFEAPEELKLLAEITDFPLFVTTAFDGLLAKALGEVKGTPPVELAYSPKRFDDLPEAVAALKEPHLYYLFGQSAAIARYAICEEDVLEWISNLQSDTHSPERLPTTLSTPPKSATSPRIAPPKRQDSR